MPDVEKKLGAFLHLLIAIELCRKIRGAVAIFLSHSSSQISVWALSKKPRLLIKSKGGKRRTNCFSAQAKVGSGCFTFFQRSSQKLSEF